MPLSRQNCWDRSIIISRHKSPAVPPGLAESPLPTHCIPSYASFVNEVYSPSPILRAKPLSCRPQESIQISLRLLHSHHQHEFRIYPSISSRMSAASVTSIGHRSSIRPFSRTILSCSGSVRSYPSSSLHMQV